MANKTLFATLPAKNPATNQGYTQVGTALDGSYLLQNQSATVAYFVVTDAADLDADTHGGMAVGPNEETTFTFTTGGDDKLWGITYDALNLTKLVLSPTV